MIHFTSRAGWLPVHRDQLRAQRSVTNEYGKLYPCILQRTTVVCGYIAQMYVFSQCTSHYYNGFLWHKCSIKHDHSHGGILTPLLMHGPLGPQASTSQTASRSVQPRLTNVPKRHIETHTDHAKSIAIGRISVIWPNNFQIFNNNCCWTACYRTDVSVMIQSHTNREFGDGQSEPYSCTCIPKRHTSVPSISSNANIVFAR